MAKNKPKRAGASSKRGRRWLFLVIIPVLLLAALGAWLVGQGQAQEGKELPEAAKVYEVQPRLPFQILVPAYLPASFQREKMEIKTSEGPSGEPMVELAYHTYTGKSVFLRQWMPVNPEKEILAYSRPIVTKWGNGWLYRQSDTLRAMWVDIGPTRVSVFSGDLDVVPEEQLLAIAETLGPPSNNQVFYFDPNYKVKDAPPPAPFEVKANDQGIQELTLVVTPGGYNPIRFAVKQGVPVRLHFRMLGQVGCGNVMIFPTSPTNSKALTLTSEKDEVVLDFTPPQAGDFSFYCAHQMYWGVMTVRP